MSFTVTKILGALTTPANLWLAILLAGTLMLILGRLRAARNLLGLATAIALLVTLLPVGAWMLKPLEDRFPSRPFPEHVDGVIVLGGAIDPAMTAARGVVSLNAAAERVTTFAILARRYPGARLVYSGGTGSIMRPEIKEAAYVADFMADLGVDPGRVLREDQSRNTVENARYSLALARPERGQTWLLVTSAAHMPRAVGVFRKAGWPVVPVPVDFRTDSRNALAPPGDVARGFDELYQAFYEWRGLIFYRLAGWSDDLFPAPEK